MGCPYSDVCDKADQTCDFMFPHCRRYNRYARVDDGENPYNDRGLSPAQRNFESHTEKYL